MAQLKYWKTRSETLLLSHFKTPETLQPVRPQALTSKYQARDNHGLKGSVWPAYTHPDGQGF